MFSTVLADCVTQCPPSSFMPWLMFLLHFHSYIRPPLLQEWSLPRHQDILLLQCCATIIVLDSEEGRPMLLYLSLHLLVLSMLFHDQLVSFKRSTLQCCKCAACKTSVVGFSFFLFFLEGLPPPPISQINTWGLILPYECLVLA